MRFYIVFFFLTITTALHAQQSVFENKLSDIVFKFNHIEKEEQYTPILNQFIDLSKAYPKEWLPYYYAAIVQTKLALINTLQQDALADLAIEWIAKCKKIQINDEVLCAESLAYTAKMSVHPTWRWLRYQDKIKGPLQNAKKINSNNPRIFVLEANLQYHLPNAFGGGCNKSLAIAKDAEKLLNLEKGKAKYLPSWGYTSIKEILTNCKF